VWSTWPHVAYIIVLLFHLGETMANEAQSIRFAGAWQSATHAYEHVCGAVEKGRSSLCQGIRHVVPEPHARVLEKISRAVPEVFAGLSYVFGVFTIPALIVSWARKVVPLFPVLKTLCQIEINPEMLAEQVGESFRRLNELFEKVMVPALLVVLASDAIFSFAVGWATLDWTKLLHGTVVSLPGALLAFKYLWKQVHEEIEDEKGRAPLVEE